MLPCGNISSLDPGVVIKDCKLSGRVIVEPVILRITGPHTTILRLVERLLVKRKWNLKVLEWRWLEINANIIDQKWFHTLRFHSTLHFFLSYNSPRRQRLLRVHSTRSSYCTLWREPIESKQTLIGVSLIPQEKG